MYELGVSTSGSMAASLDGTRLYTDELSFHRIAADPREREKRQQAINKRSGAAWRRDWGVRGRERSGPVSEEEVGEKEKRVGVLIAAVK